MLEDFDSPTLDRDRWLPHYLPAWSSRAATAASYAVHDSCLVLDVPTHHPRWLADEHEPPLRVSGLQSANRSGAVGTTDGQQAVHPGQLVREQQPDFRGHLQSAGHLEVRCRMELSPRSMAALWLCGFQEQPHDCGELCLVEVFGKDVDPGRSAEIGLGVKAIHDPRLRDDFEAPRLDLDVAQHHVYAVDWDELAATFSVDGDVVRRCAKPPRYPLQVMVAVFDFPAWSRGGDDHLVPALVVDRISTAAA